MASVTSKLERTVLETLEDIGVSARTSAPDEKPMDILLHEGFLAGIMRTYTNRRYDRWKKRLTGDASTQKLIKSVRVDQTKPVIVLPKYELIVNVKPNGASMSKFKEELLARGIDEDVIIAAEDAAGGTATTISVKQRV
jgi:hypothetical protein